MTRFFMLLSLAVVSIGCAAHPTPITTEPDGALVSVNDVGVGQSPTAYTFQFLKTQSYAVSASKPGYFEAIYPLINANTPVGGGVHLVLQPDPSWSQTAATEADNTWVKIRVTPGMKPDAMWQKLVDTVTNRYSSIEQMDVSSGYIRTVPITKTFRNPLKGDFIIRTQFLGAMASREPLIYKVKILSERSDSPGRWAPYPRLFKEDSQMIEELQNRLGAK
jgi:hypothetical protein